MRLTTLAAVLAAAALGGPAFAQGSTPITHAEVIGQWRLTITPDAQSGMSVTVESRDGGQPDFQMTITGQARGPLACVVRDNPAQCRIDDGRLIVVLPTRSGGARMTFTLTDRTPTGFSGTAGVRLRLLPFGGHVGSVEMSRR